MSRPTVREHPEYPFRPGAGNRLESSVQGFLDAPAPGDPAWRLLNEFVLLVHRFAFLERLMQGDVLYELPVHLPEPGTEANPEAEGERLAATERDLLDWLGTDAGALPGILDEIGIKVLGLAAGEEAAPPPPAAELCGGFFYEGPTGPALLVGTRLGLPEAAFVLAHEFAHLVADTNPYQARFCRWDPRTLENRVHTPEEMRADRFARALLLPEERLRGLLALLDRGGANGGEDDPRERQLAVLFDVPPTLLERRLEDLGLPRLDLARHTVPGIPDVAEAPEDGDLLGLPERFVNLVLAAYGRGLMEVPELALFLRTSAEGAEQMLEWARVPRSVDTAGEDG